MNAEQFWSLIESSRQAVSPTEADGNARRQADALRALLSKRTPAEIVEFNVHFQDRMNAAFQWDLWAVAYIVADGCSDDGFMDFRGWLISMGREVFEAAIVNANSLLQVIDAPGVEDVFFEEFQYIAAQVHASVTGGKDLPPVRARPTAPSGNRWREDELAHRFPALWAWREGKASTSR